MVRSSFLVLLLAVGASDQSDRSWIESLRVANQFAQSGLDEAEYYYEKAARDSSDPGLIAFNRAQFLFVKGDYREAELYFLRCLEDAEIPETRKAETIYNRGVCLLMRGERAAIFRAAIACFEDCLAMDAISEKLANDARYNLELAKLLWNRALLSEANRPTPNESNPPELPKTSPELPKNDVVTDGDPGHKSTPTTSDQIAGKQNGADNVTDQIKSGAGTLPVLKDSGEIQKLSPEDTESLLDRTALRLKDARLQNEALRAGPERPNVRDW